MILRAASSFVSLCLVAVLALASPAPAHAQGATVDAATFVGNFSQHGINDILMESLDAEKEGLVLYKKLLELVRDRSVFLEEYARKMIAEEEMHLGEVNKMLRKPGEVGVFVE